MNAGIWIPAEVWELPLPPLHRVFLARLLALSEKDGACFAGDEFLAADLLCTPQYVRKMRKQLQEQGLIEVAGYGNGRRLSVQLATTGTSNQGNKQPQAQKLQPQLQNLQPQAQLKATTVAHSKEDSKERSKEVVKKGREPKKEILYPWNTEAFRAAWDQWKEYKRAEHRFNYKSDISEQTALHQLQREYLNEAEAIAAIGYSIGKAYKGIYPPKKQNNGQQRNGLAITEEQYRDIITRKY